MEQSVAGGYQSYEIESYFMNQSYPWARVLEKAIDSKIEITQRLD